ncbi:MAG TPA: ATP-binding cassette domain-containing protein [Candidatus Limnocylindria bacterium]|nr:ATP-binding cassette domain-containing protein [Candidatus Limnocylindria bacterium]
MTTSTPDALWASRSIRLLHPTAVRCQGVRRSIRGVSLLAGIDLSVPVGARLLVVSRPEAAASLLLRILAGIARADGGRISLAGLTRAEAGPAGWARRVGYVGPRAAIHPWLSPREALQLAGGLADLAGRHLARQVDAALGFYGLQEVADRPMRRGGPAVAERVALAAAQLNEPDVLLLDEPLRALDPEERTRLLGGAGPRQTLILASRYPASEAGLVNRLIVLRDGAVQLNVAVTELARHGLALSTSGIETLASLPRAG